MEEQAHDRIEAGPQPKHQQLRELLIAMVVPGQAIPSERDLMATYGVSRATVRKAIDGLVPPLDALQDAIPLLPEAPCNGFWHGRPGVEQLVIH